jgi:anhydro-N-acetylmuramic acid kinase
MKILQDLSKKESLKIIGMMSGTSCDGVDLALVDINGSGTSSSFKLLHSYHKTYTSEQRSYILEALEQEKANLKEISQLNFYLAKIWSEAVIEVIDESKLDIKDIDIIGSHGHTFYHAPKVESFVDQQVSSTFQLGDPAVIAQLTGIVTIGDFRVADVALGGQGAPLVPYVDWLIFSKLKKNVLILNIGGIANFTFVPADAEKTKVQAFDTGPGNMVIDQLMERLYELPMDKNGEKAFLGQFSEKLFDYIVKLDHYPQLIPPKSTGREHYGKEFVLSILKKALRRRIPEPDVIHTLSKYTAYTIWQAAKNFIGHDIDELYVGGGGSHNKFLMKALEDYFIGVKVKRTGTIGISEDFKEAICFAILANELVHGNRSNLPGVTGASNPAFLGKICLV